MLNQILQYADGELDEEQTITLFQSLVDTGLAWELQGHYGRTAIDLINQGLITAPRVTKDECLTCF